jgi:signal transduction histidine kinase
MDLRARHLTIVTALVGALVTVLVSLVPAVNVAYRSESLHVSLDTAAALIALLVAYLVFGRFRERGQVSDLALVAALVMFGLTNLTFSALPEVLSTDRPDNVSTWASAAGILVGAGTLLYAAFVREREIRHRKRAVLGLLFACALALAAVTVLVTLFADRLPAGVPADLSPKSSGGPWLSGHPAVLAVQLVVMAFFDLAAIGFVRRAEHDDDSLMHWFAAAAAIAAFARLNYFLFPSLYSQWISTGDVLHLGFYLLLLVGAVQEIRAYWRGLARAAVLEERRRMARDLHDGLAQELAYILGRARRFAREGDEDAGHIATAAERALDESRRAIAALTRPVDEPLEIALAQAAEEVANRVGARVQCDLDHSVAVSIATREALVRIVREAVTNAGRHGKANLVTVELSNGRGLSLRIADDGSGFDPAEAEGGRGFGIVSMRERAQAIGGRFSLESAPGEGTAIEVTL